MYVLHDHENCHLPVQLASAVWHICEQTRAACGSQLGDIVVAMRLGESQQDAAQPGLAVAVAASSADTAMQALHHIVQLAVRLSFTPMQSAMC